MGAVFIKLFPVWNPMQGRPQHDPAADGVDWMNSGGRLRRNSVFGHSSSLYRVASRVLRNECDVTVVDVKL